MREGENIIRARLHPLWLAVHEVLKRDLTEHRSGIVPGRIIEFAREQKRQQCIDNIAGNAATLAVVDGLCSDVAQRALPGKVAAALHKRFDADPGRLAQKMDRVANQYRFIV